MSASIPKYVLEPLFKQDVETLRRVREIVDDLIEEREKAIEVESEMDEGEELVEQSESSSSGTTVIKKVPCGKECEGCPHGPYEYTVRRSGEKLVWDYVGPADV